MPDGSSLLYALQAGDPAALATLFETYADRIYRLALGLLQNPAEAEDVVQDTFIKAITNLGQFEGRSNISTWLYRVAYNASMDRLRIHQALPLPGEEPDFVEDGLIPLPEILVEWGTPEALVISDEDRQLLDEAIQFLPETFRSVFILRDIEELSTAQVVEVLGISASLVKVRLHRARLALREYLANHFAERQFE